MEEVDRGLARWDDELRGNGAEQVEDEAHDDAADTSHEEIGQSLAPTH